MKTLAFISKQKIVDISEYSDEVNPSHHLRDITNMVPKPEVGWLLVNGELKPITIITTGSMQRRFTLAEEAAITDGADSYAKIIRERLINASYADLEYEVLVQGIAYICNYLLSQNVITDAVKRTNELLAPGTPEEEYKGTL